MERGRPPGFQDSLTHDSSVLFPSDEYDPLAIIQRRFLPQSLIACHWWPLYFAERYFITICLYGHLISEPSSDARCVQSTILEHQFAGVTDNEMPCILIKNKVLLRGFVWKRVDNGFQQVNELESSVIHSQRGEGWFFPLIRLNNYRRDLPFPGSYNLQ